MIFSHSDDIPLSDFDDAHRNYAAPGHNFEVMRKKRQQTRSINSYSQDPILVLDSDFQNTWPFALWVPLGPLAQLQAIFDFSFSIEIEIEISIEISFRIPKFSGIGCMWLGAIEMEILDESTLSRKTQKKISSPLGPGGGRPLCLPRNV